MKVMIANMTSIRGTNKINHDFWYRRTRNGTVWVRKRKDPFKTKEEVIEYKLEEETVTPKIIKGKVPKMPYIISR